MSYVALWELQDPFEKDMGLFHAQFEASTKQPERTRAFPNRHWPNKYSDILINFIPTVDKSSSSLPYSLLGDDYDWQIFD